MAFKPARTQTSSLTTTMEPPSLCMHTAGDDMDTGIACATINCEAFVDCTHGKEQGPQSLYECQYSSGHGPALHALVGVGFGPTDAHKLSLAIIPDEVAHATDR